MFSPVLFGQICCHFCLKHTQRQEPGRKVKGVEEVGVFLFSWQLVKGIRGQEGHRHTVRMHQICKTGSVCFWAWASGWNSAVTLHADAFAVAGLCGCCGGGGAGPSSAQGLEQRLHVCKGHILGRL